MDSFFSSDAKESLGNVWSASFYGGKQKDTAFPQLGCVLLERK